MSAILWDGFNKIQGVLVLDLHRIRFQLSDFANTDLEFEIRYDEISIVNNHALFGLDEQGINIISKSGMSNVFIMASSSILRQEILKRMKTEN